MLLCIRNGFETYDFLTIQWFRHVKKTFKGIFHRQKDPISKNSSPTKLRFKFIQILNWKSSSHGISSSQNSLQTQSHAKYKSIFKFVSPIKCTVRERKKRCRSHPNASMKTKYLWNENLTEHNPNQISFSFFHRIQLIFVNENGRIWLDMHTIRIN